MYLMEIMSLIVSLGISIYHLVKQRAHLLWSTRDHLIPPATHLLFQSLFESKEGILGSIVYKTPNHKVITNKTKRWYPKALLRPFWCIGSKQVKLHCKSDAIWGAMTVPWKVNYHCKVWHQSTCTTKQFTTFRFDEVLCCRCSLGPAFLR